MFLCRKSEPGKWAVGFYDPQGRWTEESTWNSAAEASEHLHALSGGGPEGPAPGEDKFMKPAD